MGGEIHPVASGQIFNATESLRAEMNLILGGPLASEIIEKHTALLGIALHSLGSPTDDGIFDKIAKLLVDEKRAKAKIPVDTQPS